MRVTVVLPLPQRRLPRASVRRRQATAFLLQVSAAVPAVGFLRETLPRFVVNTFGIFDG